MSSDRSSFFNQIKFYWAKPEPCFDQDCDVGEKSMPSGNMCMN